MDCTGERRAIGVLDLLTDDVSEIVTSSRREYYSLTRVLGSRFARAEPAQGEKRRGDSVQLTFDADVEAFRAEFVAFLDEHLPDEAQGAMRPRSCSHVPEWAARWQRLLFDNGWLLPGNPPEFGGRNATLLQQYVHADELARRRIYRSFNPQGVGIIAASLLSFGTPEQKQRWAVPILRAEITASLGMSEPGAGSDLASLKTRAVRDSDSQATTSWSTDRRYGHRAPTTPTCC